MPARFNAEADKFLEDFYQENFATSIQQKIKLLKETIGGEWSFYAQPFPITDEMILGCLE